MSVLKMSHNERRRAEGVTLRADNVTLRTDNTELKAQVAELQLELLRRKKGFRPKANTSTRTKSTKDRRKADERKHPVWDESKTRVIGVLGRSLHLTDLLDPWEKQLQGESRPDQRFLALAESGTHGLALLDHHWMTPTNMASLKSQNALIPGQAPLIRDEESRIFLSPDQARLIREEDRTARYADPIAALDPRFAGDWLAAWAKVEGTHWIAIVQERRDVALKPVGDLKDVFVRSGYIAIGVFSVMLGVFWLLLRRASE